MATRRERATSREMATRRERPTTREKAARRERRLDGSVRLNGVVD